MKKLVVWAGVVLCALQIQAQDKATRKGLEGTVWASGTLSYNKTSTGGSDATKSTFIPVVGYFIAPTTTIGLGIGTTSDKATAAGATTKDVNSFVVMPLARKYWNVAGNFYLFGQAAMPISFGKDNITEAKTTDFGVTLSPGLDYIFNSWITLEGTFSIFNFGVNTLSPKVGDSTTTTTFNANPFDSARNSGGLTVGVKFLF